MGIQSCPSCGNNHFLYNGTSKVCTRCGAVYPDDFADLPTQPVRAASNHEFDGYFAAGGVIFIVALLVSLVSFFDTRLVVVSLGLFVVAAFPTIIFRIGNTTKTNQVFANWIIICTIVNIIVCMVRLVSL